MISFQKEQAKLMEQTDSIEIYLANKLNDLYVKLDDDDLNKTKTLLDQNNLNEFELTDLSEQYTTKINEINEQIKQVDQFQFNNYLFVASEIKEISFIGDIFIKKYVSFSLFDLKFFKYFLFEIFIFVALLNRSKSQKL